jgi:hypothetical protein
MDETVNDAAISIISVSNAFYHGRFLERKASVLDIARLDNIIICKSAFSNASQRLEAELPKDRGI